MMIYSWAYISLNTDKSQDPTSLSWLFLEMDKNVIVNLLFRWDSAVTLKRYLLLLINRLLSLPMIKSCIHVGLLTFRVSWSWWWFFQVRFCFHFLIISPSCHSSRSHIDILNSHGFKLWKQPHCLLVRLHIISPSPDSLVVGVSSPGLPFFVCVTVDWIEVTTGLSSALPYFYS